MANEFRIKNGAVLETVPEVGVSDQYLIRNATTGAIEYRTPVAFAKSNIIEVFRLNKDTLYLTDIEDIASLDPNDENYIRVYPGEYLTTINIYVALAKYEIMKGATIKNVTNSNPIFDCDTETSEINIFGKGFISANGSIVYRSNIIRMPGLIDIDATSFNSHTIDIYFAQDMNFYGSYTAGGGSCIKLTKSYYNDVNIDASSTYADNIVIDDVKGGSYRIGKSYNNGSGYHMNISTAYGYSNAPMITAEIGVIQGVKNFGIYSEVETMFTGNLFGRNTFSGIGDVFVDEDARFTNEEADLTLNIDSKPIFGATVAFDNIGTGTFTINGNTGANTDIIGNNGTMIFNGYADYFNATTIYGKFILGQTGHLNHAQCNVQPNATMKVYGKITSSTVAGADVAIAFTGTPITLELHPSAHIVAETSCITNASSGNRIIHWGGKMTSNGTYTIDTSESIAIVNYGNIYIDKPNTGSLIESVVGGGTMVQTTIY